MGNEIIVEDPNIQIFLELKSLVHKAGSKVKGCIYLETRQYANYSELVLRIECFQKTQFKQQKDKHKEPTTEQRRTYFDQIKLAEFLNGFYKGQYQFPFSFYLPSEIPGSLVFGLNNYLRYKVTAYLQSAEPFLSNQVHSRQIWVLQKFQGVTEPIFSRQIQEAKCCMWGYSYGNVQTLVECQTNNVEPGQKMKIRFQIDTKKMSTQVKKTKIRLIQKSVEICGEFIQQKQFSELFSFDFNQIMIEKGQTRKLEKNIQFPVDILPTSIGQILCRIYVIEVHLWFSCYSQLVQSFDIFINSSKNGLNEQNKPFPKPARWKPLKYKKLELRQLKSYDDKFDKRIAFHNKKVQNNRPDIMKPNYPGSDRRLNS